jgi:hypothetical protein
MATVQCHNGHHYDDRRHTHCPHCPVPGLKDVQIPGIPVRGLRDAKIPGPQTGPGWLGRAISALSIERLRGTPHENLGGMPRVFISSTFKDLELFRQAAFEAIQSLGGVGENMIYWSADDTEPSGSSVSKVRSSDLMVLILAHRYGYLPKNSSYSITELEYRAAREANVPVLAFIVDGRTPWPP